MVAVSVTANATEVKESSASTRVNAIVARDELFEVPSDTMEENSMNQEVFQIDTLETVVESVSTEAVKEEVEVVETIKIPTDITDSENLVEKSVDLDGRALFIRDGITYEVTNTLEVTATAYCHCFDCCGKNPGDAGYGITKSGFNLLECEEDPHVVAADWSIIPQGTEMYIEVPESARDLQYVKADYGFATVEDAGGKIKGNRIDIYFSTHEEAIAWGVRKVNVYVLEPAA